MFYKKQIGRHALVIVRATIPALPPRVGQVPHLPPIFPPPTPSVAT